MAAQAIIDNSIQFYGQERWDHTHISFQFREYSYSLFKKGTSTIYTRKKEQQVDSLIGFKRLVRYQDAQPIKLSDSLQNIYSSSVNSVLYFFQIPRILNDPAVIKTRLADMMIQGRKYHALKITFQPDGGGTDYQDEFRYWIDAKTFAIDFMAYKYLTDGGGIRFRKATNRRTIGESVFQDYDNFKPTSKVVSLDDLPRLYEQGKLIKVSTIANTSIAFRKN